MPLTEPMILAVIGLFAGILGGLLGVGGSVIMIPAMIYLIRDPNQHQFQGAAMIVNFFVILPAVMAHRKADAILWPVVRVMIPCAVGGVLAGVALSSASFFAGANEVYLSRVFGVFLLYAAAYNVMKLVRNRQMPEIDQAAAARISKSRIALAVGLPMGLVGGLLGVGGGALAVPAQQVFLRMPIRRAIANSATSILVLCVFGAVFKNYLNTQDGISLQRTLTLVLFLAPCAVLGGYLGGRLTHVIHRQGLRVAVILLMCYGGVSMILRGDDSPASEVPSPVEELRIDSPNP